MQVVSSNEYMVWVKASVKNQILANAIKEEEVNFSPRDLTTLMLELHKQHKKKTIDKG
jgi:hypothetical protein